MSNIEKLEKQQYAVFVVEDDIDDQILMLKTLRQSEHISKIHCFGSGDQLIGQIAIERHILSGPLGKTNILVLLDIHLPGASGMEILEDLKDNPLTSGIPVIIVTSDPSKEKHSEALRLKASGYINKPIALEQIHKIIADE
jgi:CheY-like chemotaxis protein